MNVIMIILKLIGSLGILLYGMRLMSDGIQKSSGERLQRTLSVMAGNRFVGLFTGMFITMIIQSSGATSVMVITFVNAGLMTLAQSVGVIFGANIGTTITAWIVSLFGFSFNISEVAIPIVGVGFFLSTIKKRNYNHIGEALMGFGFLFIGLSNLSSVFTFDSGNFGWLAKVQNLGVLSIIIGYFIGIVITALLHSSSAFTAIVITLSVNGLVTWEIAAAMTLGADLGSTIDAILASLNSTQDGKRVALVHVLFNLIGNIFALIFFKPFLSLIVFMTPTANIAIRIALLHTMFKVFSAVLLLPFTKQMVKLVCFLIKDKKVSSTEQFQLQFPEGIDIAKTNATTYIIRAEKAISDMCEMCVQMFNGAIVNFSELGQSYVDKNMIEAEQIETYLDDMHEKITHYLVKCESLQVTEHQLAHISLMIQTVDELENLSDNCYTAAFLMAKSIKRKMVFSKEATDILVPYVDMARQFMQLIRQNINHTFNESQFKIASNFEEQIDAKRKEIKKLSRKRIEDGANVKAELLYIDMVRQIEKIGDNCFAIAKASDKIDK
ncbi:MAG: Na/Pi cotransporter family protein [Treponemataceae bacterium]|nr:Na/Pi cotransporter family protein [Spirochaetales bacterium]MDY6031663.1 Na/Pi cotransporter family protein [Treponemataceae bacterium]